MDLNIQWINIKDSVCSTCLSEDRILSLANTMDHIIKLFPDLKIGQYDKICWECKAMLKKATMFYKRAHSAQALLAIAAKRGMLNNLQSLTQLKIMKPESISCSEFLYNEDTIKEEGVTKDNLDTEDSDVKLKLEVFPALSPTRGSETETSSEAEELAMLNERIDPQPLEVIESKKDETVADPKCINFDIKTGKYYKDIFRIITLTDSDLARIKEKKLTNALFNNNPKKCLKCMMSFISDKALESHAVKHQDISGLFECKVCQQRWFTQEELDEHTKLHYISFACLFCKRKLTTLQAALQHYDLNHHQTKRQCKDCKESFSTVKQLYKHRGEAHGADFTCTQCDKSFTHMFKLNSHKRIHEKVDLKVECPICHKLYRSALGLRLHTQIRHENKVDEAAYCVECNTQFSTVIALRKHRTTSLKHNTFEDLKFECDSCGKRFGWKRSLRSHLERKHGNAKQYKCNHCTSVFKSLTYLRIHNRNKHEGRQRPRNHMCHVCGKAFCEKNILEQHLFAHRGYRPFVCDICSADFSHSGAMYTHKKLKHGHKKKLK